MLMNELLSSAVMPVEIGQDEIELVAGGTAAINYDAPTASLICPGCTPPQPK